MVVRKAAPRVRATAGGIVNGLAIRTADADLAQYSRAEVAGGSGSFVMDVADYRDFPAAIRLKLLREIRPLTASLQP